MKTSSKRIPARPVYYNSRLNTIHDTPTGSKADNIYFPSTSEFYFYKFCNQLLISKGSVIAHPLVTIVEAKCTYTPDIMFVCDDVLFLNRVRRFYGLPESKENLLYIEWKGDIHRDKTFHTKIKNIMIHSNFTDNCLFVGNIAYSIISECIPLGTYKTINIFSRDFFYATIVKTLA